LLSPNSSSSSSSLIIAGSIFIKYFYYKHTLKKGLRLSSQQLLRPKWPTFKAISNAEWGSKITKTAKETRGRERESFRQSQGLFADSFLGVVVVVVVMSREGFIVLEDWMQKKDRNHAKTW